MTPEDERGRERPHAPGVGPSSNYESEGADMRGPYGGAGDYGGSYTAGGFAGAGFGGGYYGYDRSSTSASGGYGGSTGRQSHAGRGPRRYRRSDERIMEDVSERLTTDPDVDATDIEVTVTDGHVTLSGTVDDRRAKRLAEVDAEDVWGVVEVENRLRVTHRDEGRERVLPS
jgi:osmotically-inducible protein OsmY